MKRDGGGEFNSTYLLTYFFGLRFFSSEVEIFSGGGGGGGLRNFRGEGVEKISGGGVERFSRGVEKFPGGGGGDKFSSGG